MAEAEDVETVKDNIPSDAAGQGWDDDKIAAIIDGGLTTSRTIRSYWSWRVANTTNLVSISESGSSRDLSKIHQQALDMLKYWDAKIVDEENDTDSSGESQQPIAFHRWTRV